MSYSWEHILILLAAGIGGRLSQGMLGVGGCFIMVPVTTFVFQDMGVPLDTAVKLTFGTNLLVLTPGVISRSLGHHWKVAVWWKAGIILGIFVVIGALLGVYHNFPVYKRWHPKNRLRSRSTCCRSAHAQPALLG